MKPHPDAKPVNLLDTPGAGPGTLYLDKDTNILYHYFPWWVPYTEDDYDRAKPEPLPPEYWGEHGVG